MTVQTLFSAESWDRIYDAFEQVNFVSYDFHSIKQALIDYMKIYYPEHFNDFIESSELIAIIDMFAVTAEQLAYRIDLAAHENSLESAERKQSILRLAKFISYNATRNIPARGLVKMTSIATTEEIIDSQGINLANRTIRWNDPANPFWKEQFFLIMDRVLRRPFGQPSKAFQVDGTRLELYELESNSGSFPSGTFPYSVTTNNETIPMEVVSSDLDQNGVFERFVDGQNQLGLVYGNDGLGDSSDMTGFLFYTKQGTLLREEFEFEEALPGQIYETQSSNINHLDVWLNQVDSDGQSLSRWQKVETTFQQNISFNDNSERHKFEVETLEDDRVRLVFGDGEFAVIPRGRFHLHVRSSAGRNLVIQKTRVVDEPLTFSYGSNFDITETCSMTFSLVSSLQNAAESEDLDHIRRVAPLTYYTQNRMVNAQDYNSFLLRDPSILKLHAINRTFIGQPRFQDRNEASGQYQNIKVFGDDLRLYYEFDRIAFSTTSATRRMIDEVIEPLLRSPAIQNILHYQIALHPELQNVHTIARDKFIEDRLVGLQEKTRIQGVLDSHFYGEPISFIRIGDQNYAEVGNDTDLEIWDTTLPRIVGNTIIEDSRPSGLQAVPAQVQFGLKYNPTRPFRRSIDNLDGLVISASNFKDAAPDETWTIECVNVGAQGGTFTIAGSVSGIQDPYTIGDNLYDNGLFSMTILADERRDYAIGDAFILTLSSDASGDRSLLIREINIAGEWTIIDGANLDTDANFQALNNGAASGLDASWVIWLQQNVDARNNAVDYTITHRSLKTVVTSTDTHFWYNSSAKLIDNATGNTVRDKVSLLKSNLKIDGTQALGRNISFDVIGPITRRSGIPDLNSLEIFPKGDLDRRTRSEINRTQRDQFPDFVNITPGNEQYVYFEFDPAGDLIPVAPSPAVTQKHYDRPGQSLSVDGQHIRKIGRSDLDFLWQHFSTDAHLIDPSTSNINDIFVLTRGYYQNVMDFVDGKTATAPLPPSALELRNSYRELLDNKMLSDTVVLHSGRLKLLFGNLAEPQLRARFRAIKTPQATLTDSQIKLEISNVINRFFNIDHWDFGQSFHFTQLATLIHQTLPQDLASVVLVPTFSDHLFGSLFVVDAGEDEILQAAVSPQDIEIVDAFTPLNLRQNPTR